MITLTCLALAVYFEARSEPIDGQRAVADVIMARTYHPSFPNTVCEVIAEDRGSKPLDCQFSFMCDGKPERPTGAAWLIAQAVAIEAMAGPPLVYATHYHTTDVQPNWHDLTVIGKIGSHIFYTDGRCILKMGCSLRPKARPVTPKAKD
jgi:spore germination cell wall hydrolase CwlJ-like protein